MARYLVGNGTHCWRFEDAYNAASAGDIIEFDRNYSFIREKEHEYIIDKNLTFVGHVENNENGGKSFLNVLSAKFIINKGANVTFENFWIDQLDTNNIIVKEESSLTLNNIVFDSTLEENKYHLVLSYSKTQVFANHVEIKYKNSPLAFGFREESKAVIENSIINGRVFIQDNSEVELRNVAGYVESCNFINMNSGTVLLEDCNVESVKKDKNYPIIFAKDASVISKRNVIKQVDYESTVFLENSKIDSEDDFIGSLHLYRNSQAVVNNLVIDNRLLIEQKSFLRSKGSLIFNGEFTEKVDFCAFKDSVLAVDNVEFKKPLNPSLRLKYDSFAYVGNIVCDGDNKKIKFEADDTSVLVDNRNNKTSRKNNNISVEQKVAEKEDALDQLNALIGLKQVKKEIHKMLRLVEFNKKREAQGLKPEKQALHCVFMGNPGTGKTTVARLMGQILFEYGVLTGDTPIFEEVSQEDLVSENVGGTAPLTRKWLDKARGGILFVDEAYNLYKKEGINHGQEAIDTIMKYMEDYRDEIIVIFAGYTKEMEQFLKSNPGLESRAPNILYFEDYSEAEIVKMGQMILAKDQYTLEDSAYYEKHVSLAYSNSLDGSNARWIRNFNQKLTRTLANRVIEEDADDVSLIINKDIDNVVNINRAEFVNSEDALEKLNKLIGIQTVKEQINDFIALADMNKKRADAGLKTDDFSLHSLFLGNPGTGKTTVARIVGDLLFQKGIIKQNKFIEASRSDLVGKYIGHTAAKTREVLESALGGILFIDEAYTLNAKSESDFGQEAIDEILKFMEDHRRDIVIIFAGYNKEMADFLNTNSGLRSRVPNMFDFTDYSPDEIVSIGLLKLHSSGYNINETVYAENVKEAYSKSNDNSNGRWIRNYNERLLRIVSSRLANANVSPEEYNNILDEDILRMKEV